MQQIFDDGESEVSGMMQLAGKEGASELDSVRGSIRPSVDVTALAAAVADQVDDKAEKSSESEKMQAEIDDGASSQSGMMQIAGGDGESSVGDAINNNAFVHAAPSLKEKASDDTDLLG